MIISHKLLTVSYISFKSRDIKIRLKFISYINFVYGTLQTWLALLHYICMYIYGYKPNFRLFLNVQRSNGVLSARSSTPSLHHCFQMRYSTKHDQNMIRAISETVAYCLKNFYEITTIFTNLKISFNYSLSQISIDCSTFLKEYIISSVASCKWLTIKA